MPDRAGAGAQVGLRSQRVIRRGLGAPALFAIAYGDRRERRLLLARRHRRAARSG